MAGTFLDWSEIPFKAEVIMLGTPGDGQWHGPGELEPMSPFVKTLKRVSRRVSRPAATGLQTSEQRPSDGYIAKRKRRGKTEDAGD